MLDIWAYLNQKRCKMDKKDLSLDFFVLNL